MAVLVTGGAGYIGAHVVEALTQDGSQVVVVDDLSAGFGARLGDVPLHRLDVSSAANLRKLTDLITEHKVNSVVHFAAQKRVDESVANPLKYYSQNIDSLEVVLEAMAITGVQEIVFSSSAAVYGDTGSLPVTEDSELLPINPYGRTKLVGEWMMADAARAYGLKAVSLRYFNVAGCSRPELGDRAVLNLVPMVIRAISSQRRPVIFGDDYPTPDGTCVRDFVHVRDVARAHLAGLEFCASLAPGTHDVFNVGTGNGTSVRAMISLLLEASQSKTRPEVRPRRSGDAASVTADVSKIQRRMNWNAEFTPLDIVTSAWESFIYFEDMHNRK
jgi:UDP-glucose 4-epimerase